jgi:riboflavin synthase
MFTGIVEHIGTIEALTTGSDGGRVTIRASSIAPSLAVSNSIAVNGCCLTVVALDGDRFSADLSGETLQRTSFGANSTGLKLGSRVNLEQPLTAGKEFGGHFVLGHVDGVGEVTHLRPEGENWWYGVRVPEDFARYVVPKGSVTIDGISLTVARWHTFATPQSQYLTIEIAVIPYTYEHTNLGDREQGDAVNLEGDILGKYIEHHLEVRKAGAATSALTIKALKDQGF